MNKSAKLILVLASLATLGSGVVACDQPPAQDDSLGTLKLSLSNRDAVFVYDVFVRGAGGFEVERFVGVAQTGPSSELIASAFFTLAPGFYDVTATPVHGHGIPSPICGATHGTATVKAGQTTGVTLISSCKSVAAGGLDVTIVPNGAPDWVSVDLAPSVLVPVCQNVTITLAANDPEADPVGYTLDLTSSVHGSHPTLAFSGSVGTFTADRNGNYGFTANACDPFGCSPFSFLVGLTMIPDDDTDGNGLADACQPE
ncbi:MAG TPA: hypothetical protein VFH68_10910 [Polyangia bacterium]|jgi:hypothetical protein|nr:hypothetical protein [Polyangia bacterium]